MGIVTHANTFYTGLGNYFLMLKNAPLPGY